MPETRDFQRKKYIDVIRYISIVWIMITHFITYYDSNIFNILYDFPLGIILYGVSGKFAVAMLAVVLGYLASLSGEKNIIRYSINRYVQFFIMAFTIDFILFCSSLLGLYIPGITMFNVLTASIKLDASIFPTFWCMRHFLYGSIICAINSNIKNNKTHFILIIFEIIFLLITNKIWILFCVFGSIINYLKKFENITNVLNNKFFLIICFILIFVFIKREENNLTYIIDGIISFLLILILDNNKTFQKTIDNIHIPNFLLNSYLGLFLIHPLVIYNYCNHIRINPFFDFVAYFVICSVLAYILSMVLSFLILNSKRFLNSI